MPNGIYTYLYQIRDADCDINLCGTNSPLYRCFRDTRFVVWAQLGLRDKQWAGTQGRMSTVPRQAPLFRLRAAGGKFLTGSRCRSDASRRSLRTTHRKRNTRLAQRQRDIAWLGTRWRPISIRTQACCASIPLCYFRFAEMRQENSLRVPCTEVGKCAVGG